MWYEKQQKEKKIKLLKKAIAIILFIDVGLFDLSYFQLQKIKLMDKEINKFNEAREVKYKQKKLIPKNISALETLKNFYNYPYIYNKCNWISVKDKEVETEIRIESQEDYYNLIKFLDETERLKINYISPMENNTVKLIIHLR